MTNLGVASQTSQTIYPKDSEIARFAPNAKLLELIAMEPRFSNNPELLKLISREPLKHTQVKYPCEQTH